MGVFRYRDKWRAVVYANGRIVASQGGFDTKREAKTWHDDTAVARRGGTDAPQARTMDELIEHFRKWHLPNVRPRTRAIYETDLKHRVEPFFKFVALDKIDEPLLESFKREVAKDLKPATANLTLDLVRLLLNKAVKWRMLKVNPYQIDPLPVPKVAYEWWQEREQIRRFLQEARASRYYAVYLVALETGMRYAEIVGLSKGDIDFEAGTIHVHRQWMQEQMDFGPTKHNQERWIDFDPTGELGLALRAECRRSPDAEAVFVTATGKRPTKGGLAGKYYRAIQKRAEVPRISFHALRHTFASWYMREHSDIWALKAILGHSSIKTTMRYAHHSKKQRLPLLNMSGVVAHKSLTGPILKAVSGGEERRK